MNSIESRLAELGIALPQPPKPIANYLPYVLAGGLLTVSGQIPIKDGQLMYPGKLGDEVDIEQGQMAARLALVNLLAQVKIACDGDLGRVVRVVRLGGFIAATGNFSGHAQVMNGASDLIVDIFGEPGKHARSTVGVSSLPVNAAVEIEGLFQIR